MNKKELETFAKEAAKSLKTEEDIRDQAIEEVEDKLGLDSIPDDITESEMYNHARKEIIKSFNGENISGLYLVESLRDVAIRMNRFLLSNDLIDDVYASDEDMITFLVGKIRGFNIRKFAPQHQQQ